MFLSLFLRARRAVAVFAALTGALGALRAAPAEKLNVMIITVDDMSCDSVGVYGSKVKDITPNMDRLAGQSMRFNHAYVQVGNCMPSRNVMFSGRYPHNNRVEGFYMVREPGYPVMADLMKAGGYFTGIRHKVAHSTPYSPYPAWDVVLDTYPDGKPASVKSPEAYYATTKHALARATQAGKPFCLNLNIADPHKPFYGEAGGGEGFVPSKVYTAKDVPVPGFLGVLGDDLAMREELAMYYSSVRRADDALGQILRALKESGQEERTVIFFLSDHGMPLPFAKTQLYFHSTRTPWMVRWPGVTKAGGVDDRHVVSGVDLLPTLLEIVGLKQPDGMDGRSFAPVLRGQTQEGRDYMVAEYNENSGGFRHPMRSIITKEHAYVFNPWSNGSRVMATATKGTVTYRRMQALAKTDKAVAERLTFFDQRVPEELYDYRKDDDALENLIAKPEHAPARERLTRMLEEWMVRTKDPMLAVFRGRADPKVREAYMKQVEAEAAERGGRAARREAEGQEGKKAGKGGKKKGGAGVTKKDAVPDL